MQRSSPRLVTVAEGQTIYLNITLNGTGDIVPMLVFLDWNFQTSNSRTMKRLLSVTWDQGYVVSEEFHDERASLLDNASLMLVDATLNDAGSYWCNAFSLPSKFYPVVYFNVSIKGMLHPGTRPKIVAIASVMAAMSCNRIQQLVPDNFHACSFSLESEILWFEYDLLYCIVQKSAMHNFQKFQKFC